MDRGGKGKTAIPEEKEDEPSLLPMTPESKQLAAVIATAVATAMAGKSASPDSSSSMVRYSAGVSLASRTRSIISIVRNLKLHLVTLPGANLASNELLLKLCKAYFALRQLTDQAGVSLLIGLEEKTEKNVITKEEALLKLEAGEEIGSWPSGMPSTICFASDNELSELWRCVRVLMLDACDRERCARGRHVGVGLRCAEPEL